MSTAATGGKIEVRIGARGVTRRFGSVLANSNISFRARAGSIHALVGANGAGKTTLMRILHGMERPDSGAVLCNDEPIVLSDPADAFSRGIGMVHQEFMLVPGLSLLENLILSNEPTTRLGMIDEEAARQASARVAAEAGVSVDWDLAVEDAPIHQLQILEILRLLYRGADVLILDEPTSALAPAQVRELSALMRRLRDEGRTILFISHKLDEVLAVADEITVLRAGRVAASLRREEADARKLAELMVGSAPAPPLAKRANRIGGEIALTIDNLSVRDSRRVLRLKGVSLEVRVGEIVGLAGVAGNGQDELVAAAAGLIAAEGGRVLINGKDATRQSVATRRADRLAYLSPDRAAEGLCLAAEVWENAIAGRHRRAEFNRRGILRRADLYKHARALLDRFDVQRAGDHDPTRTLSGGNQQRLAMARELDGDPKILIAAQPTRGVDIRGCAFIHARLLDFRDGGGAVLLISEELSELLTLSDRIAVLYAGRLAGVLAREEATIEAIGRLMLGGAA
jgi:general nucleoside transport system ATP-binding protein